MRSPQSTSHASSCHLYGSHPAMIIVGTDWPMQQSDAATSHQAPHSHSYRYKDSYQVGGSLLAESPL
ncbi:MAG: hypothetical protein ACFB0D_19275, partial [Phormidesmis sp.]